MIKAHHLQGAARVLAERRLNLRVAGCWDRMYGPGAGFEFLAEERRLQEERRAKRAYALALKGVREWREGSST